MVGKRLIVEQELKVPAGLLQRQGHFDGRPFDLGRAPDGTAIVQAELSPGDRGAHQPDDHQQIHLTFHQSCAKNRSVQMVNRRRNAPAARWLGTMVHFFVHSWNHHGEISHLRHRQCLGRHGIRSHARGSGHPRHRQGRHDPGRRGQQLSIMQHLRDRTIISAARAARRPTPSSPSASSAGRASIPARSPTTSWDTSI
jgi:hypothetical protein